MKIYGVARSRSTRGLWAAAEANIDCEFVSLNFRAGEHRQASFLAINPAGKVPALVDGDVVLTESGAIVNYIANRYAPDLIPSQMHMRALYDQWSYFCLTELEQPLWTIGKHKFALPAEQRIADIFPTAQWEFQQALKLLSEGLGNSSFILGESFHMVDVLLAETIEWAIRFKQDIPYDNVKSYLARCQDRKGYKAMLEKEERNLNV